MASVAKKERSLMSESTINKEVKDIKKEQTVGLLEAIDRYKSLVNDLEIKIYDIQSKITPVLKMPPPIIYDMELREVDAAPTTVEILMLNLKIEKLINILHNLENNVGI